MTSWKKSAPAFLSIFSFVSWGSRPRLCICRRSLGPVDSTEIVILLVRRTALVGGKKLAFLQGVADELRHRLERSGEIRKIRAAHDEGVYSRKKSRRFEILLARHI